MILVVHKGVNYGEYAAIGVCGPEAVYDFAKRRVLCGGREGTIAWQWAKVTCENCLTLKLPAPSPGASLDRLTSEFRALRREVHRAMRLIFLAR